ncbi:MAG: hypothetical protein Q6K70_05110 [Thermostichales cyanobacterium DRC_bins_46]
MKISASTQYTLRQILKRWESRLTSVVSPGAALSATRTTDLNQVLASLYPDEEQICESARQLERLVDLYRHLQEHPLILQRLEQEMFWILGLKPAA